MAIKFFKPDDAPVAPPQPTMTQATRMTIALEIITPEIAQQLLDHNTDNRPLRKRLQAARDGRFNFTAAERMALVVKAWNATREDKKLTTLSWRPFEEFPAIL